jgi:uncharacterized protein
VNTTDPDADDQAPAVAPDNGVTAGVHADDISADPETGPLRRCIVTRERLAKERMIRFVVGPNRQLVPDLTATLPGRGMWLSASGDVLQSQDSGAAANRNLVRAFARAARGPVTVPDDLSGLLQAALLRRISERLGLARRAGQAVAGFEKAREMLRSKRARLVMEAADGSLAERARFLSGSGTGEGLKIIDPLSGKALGQVFGRDYVVHVAVAPGKLADSLVVEADRLAGLMNRSARTTGSEWTAEQGTAPVHDGTGANG